jgi:hypothetical protein
MTIDTASTIGYDGTMTDTIHTFAPGDFITESLVSDTKTWEVIAVTPQTITIRPTRPGKVLWSASIDGNPYPVTYSECVPHYIGKGHPWVRTLRRRKDGTFRVAS